MSGDSEGEEDEETVEEEREDHPTDKDRSVLLTAGATASIASVPLAGFFGAVVTLGLLPPETLGLALVVFGGGIATIGFGLRERNAPPRSNGEGGGGDGDDTYV